MAIQFPSNPTDGQTFVAGNGSTYTYNSTLKSWKVTNSGGGGDSSLTFGYGLDEVSNNVDVDTDTIVDTDYLEAYVAGEYANDLTYELLNTSQAFYSNNISVGSGQAYLNQNSGGHTTVWVGEPHSEQRHHKFLKVQDSETNAYSIYRIKYTTDFHGGSATQFVCEAPPVYNSTDSEVNENASSFIIESNGDGSFSVGYGLTHDSESGSIIVDTEVIADTEWVRQNAAGVLDLAFSGAQNTTTIRLRNINNNANLDTITIDNDDQFGIDATVSGSFLRLNVDTEVIATVEYVGSGRLLAGNGVEFPSGQSFNANNTIDATLQIDTEWFDNRDLTWSNIVLGGAIGASGTNSSSQSYLTYTYKSNIYYRVFVSGGESVRTDFNDAATEVVSKTY